jgi:hypothetical protein
LQPLDNLSMILRVSPSFSRALDQTMICLSPLSQIELIPFRLMNSIDISLHMRCNWNIRYLPWMFIHLLPTSPLDLLYLEDVDIVDMEDVHTIKVVDLSLAAEAAALTSLPMHPLLPDLHAKSVARLDTLSHATTIDRIFLLHTSNNRLLHRPIIQLLFCQQKKFGTQIPRLLTISPMISSIST